MARYVLAAPSLGVPYADWTPDGKGRICPACKKKILDKPKGTNYAKHYEAEHGGAEEKPAAGGGSTGTSAPVCTLEDFLNGQRLHYAGSDWPAWAIYTKGKRGSYGFIKVYNAKTGKEFTEIEAKNDADATRFFNTATAPKTAVKPTSNIDLSDCCNARVKADQDDGTLYCAKCHKECGIIPAGPSESDIRAKAIWTLLKGNAEFKIERGGHAHEARVTHVKSGIGYKVFMLGRVTLYRDNGSGGYKQIADNIATPAAVISAINKDAASTKKGRKVVEEYSGPMLMLAKKYGFKVNDHDDDADAGQIAIARRVVHGCDIAVHEFEETFSVAVGSTDFDSRKAETRKLARSLGAEAIFEDGLTIDGLGDIADVEKVLAWMNTVLKAAQGGGTGAKPSGGAAVAPLFTVDTDGEDIWVVVRRSDMTALKSQMAAFFTLPKWHESTTSKTAFFASMKRGFNTVDQVKAALKAAFPKATIKVL